MADDNRKKNPSIETILMTALKTGASDIHLKVGSRPILRVQGKLSELQTVSYNIEGIKSTIKSILPTGRQAEFYENKNMDCSLTIDTPEGKRRFRINAAREINGPYLTMRVIPAIIKNVIQIRFPNDVWKDITALKRGLVLVTGITGSGKTTTLASLIREINNTRSEHIVTIEDPIEYVHPNK